MYIVVKQILPRWKSKSMAVPGLVCPGAVPAEMICRSGAGGELGSIGRVGFPAHFGTGKVNPGSRIRSARRWTGKSTLPGCDISLVGGTPRRVYAQEFNRMQTSACEHLSPSNRETGSPTPWSRSWSPWQEATLNN